MPNYVIYTDASCDHKRGFCTWGCLVISPNGKQTSYAGHYMGMKSITLAELYAIVKAIGKVKAIRHLHLEIYTDALRIVDAIQALDLPQVRRRSSRYQDGIWHNLHRYLKTMNITIRHIPREQNLAHPVAKGELDRLRLALEEETKTPT